jgi:hypothetical protein
MTKNKWIQDAIKHRGALRKTATKQGLIKGDEKLSMSDLNKLEKEGGKTAKQASLAKTLRSFADGGIIASNIIMQLGGFSRLQIMLGAYNFVDLKNGISFKIKNARSNYIKITLNGKDLYDIEIGRIRGNTYKIVYKQEDVYAVDLRHIIENKTGMYLAFENGGDIPMDGEILIISQVDKLSNGGITAMEVLEAREFVGEDDWKKMKPKERLSATRYLVKTGKIGYYEKSRKYADGVQLNKYKVKYLIGYTDDEDGLKYQEGKFYGDSKDNVALEVFEHFKRLGYSHIEILGIMLVADKGIEVKLSDSELNEKYSKIKGDLPNWFKDMPTQYKEEIIEEIEEEEFSKGGGIGSKRDNVVNYYINNMEDDVLIDKFDVSEDYLKDRNNNYNKIFDIISDNIDDEDISYRFDELNLGEDSEEPDYMENYKNGGFTSSFSGTPDRRRVTMADGGEIDWGADLGDGFSVGNDVFITDSKSLHKGKTGFVTGLVGKDLLITILVNGNERSVVLSKKGVEKLDAPEFADGGELDEEDSLDYNSISDLQSERNRLVRWSNQYGSKGADYKIKQLEQRIEYLKSQSKMADGGMTDKGSKEMINVLNQIKSDFDSFKPEIMKWYSLEIDKNNSSVIAKFYERYWELNKKGEPDSYDLVGTKHQIRDWADRLNWRSNVEIDFNYENREYDRLFKFIIKVISIPKIEPKIEAKNIEEKEEETWIITYSTQNDNTDKVWVYGRNKDEAIENAKDEYWDIEEIISVTKMAEGGKVKDPHPDYPDFVSMQYKKGGALKYYDKENEYKIGRPSGYIEKGVLSRVDSKEEDFVGSFGWKTESKKLADGYLYKLSDFDKQLVRDIRLKSGEKIFRYFNYNSAIGGMKPLIKINLDKELLYFLKDSNKIEFETRGIQAIWVALIEHKL